MTHSSYSDVVAALRGAGCVFADDEASLLLAASEDPATLATLLARRVAGEPLETVLGWVEFCGLRLVVRQGVFVPRRRTELLATTAADLTPAGGVVVDLCCGVGAVAAVVESVAPTARVVASDRDPAAVECARENLRGAVYSGDLFDALPRDLLGSVGVLAANVPYVPTSAIASMPPEARDHEPHAALDGGADGLDVARRLLDAAPPWLAPDGLVLIEVGEQQIDPALTLFRDCGFAGVLRRDPERDARIVVASLSPS